LQNNSETVVQPALKSGIGCFLMNYPEWW